MPIRYLHPFENPIQGRNAAVNVYVDSFLKEQSNIYFGESLKSCYGKWNQLFKTPLEHQISQRPLILEIGCHKGKTLLNLAKHHPAINFIGMDITFKRVALTAQRALKHQLPNVVTTLSSAFFIDDVFSEEEVDGVVIFFPDPWPKKKHAHHRLLNSEVAKKLARILKPKEGFIWLKTDQSSYFDFAQSSLISQGFKLTSSGFPQILGNDYTSSFEERYKSLGLPIYSGVFQI